MVVTFLPATLEMGVMQERVASPLMCTVQAPHSAMPQPNFVPVMLRVSRSTQSKGMSGLTSTVCGFSVQSKRGGGHRALLGEGDIVQQIAPGMKIADISLGLVDMGSLEIPRLFLIG